MRIVFTLITILFFSFNNANAEVETDNDALLKGYVLAHFTKENGHRSIITRYRGKIWECFILSAKFVCYAKTNEYE